jgi:hypothetical protein
MQVTKVTFAPQQHYSWSFAENERYQAMKTEFFFGRSTNVAGLVALFLALPAIVPAQLLYTTHSGAIRTNRFGFDFLADANAVIVVEASTNLALPTWRPLATNTLIDGFAYYSDPGWRNYPGRFYRLRLL